MQLHFQESGQGPPLLILHGLFGSLDNWAAIAKKLAEKFRVFAVDQRNHGQSPHVPEMDYRLMAADLADFMHARGLQHAALMGHSMGGKTAMQLALSYPAYVTALVVVDIAPRVYPPSHIPIFKALRALKLEQFQNRGEVETALAPALPDLVLRRFLLKSLKRDSIGAFHWKLGLEELYQNYESLLQVPKGESTYEGPTLFVRGERSRYLNDLDLPAIHKLFPRAQLKTIPRAGHWLHAENPTDFLETITGFLSESGV
jgi:esterase